MTKKAEQEDKGFPDDAGDDEPILDENALFDIDDAIDMEMGEVRTLTKGLRYNKSNLRKLDNGVEVYGIGEVFYDWNSGEYGYAWVRSNLGNKGITVHTASVEEDYTEGQGKAIVALGKEMEIYYHLPGIPIIEDDPDLFRDIMRAVYPWVEFPTTSDSEEGGSIYDPVFAAYLVHTYLTFEHSINPRWGLEGLTTTGKGRAMGMVKFIGYHGFAGSASVAAMFRLSDWYGCTTILDEIQDHKDDKDGGLTDIIHYIKCGYNKEKYVRAGGSKNDKLLVYSTDSAVCYSFKDYKPPVDVINRSLRIIMTKNTRPVMLDDPADNEEFMSIRSRLTALRLKVLAGLIDTEAIKEKARAYVGDKLKGRAAQIARVWVFSCLIAGGSECNVKEIIEAMQENEEMVSEAEKDSFEAWVFYALEECLSDGLKESRIDGGKLGLAKIAATKSTRDVTEKLNYLASEAGILNQEKKEKYRTRTVTNALEHMKFKLSSGAKNKTYFNERTFERVYKQAKDRFGKRPQDESKKGD